MIDHKHIKEYLESQRSTIWGQSFNVHMPDTREKAINWLDKVIDDLFEIAAKDVNL